MGHTSGAPLQEAGRIHEVHEWDDRSAVSGLSPPVHSFSNGFLSSSRAGALYRVEGCVFARATSWVASRVAASEDAVYMRCRSSQGAGWLRSGLGFGLAAVNVSGQ